MVLETIGNLLLLAALGVAAGGGAGLLCAPVLVSDRVRSLVRRLGPTPSLPVNYVALAVLLGVPAVLLQVAGTELLTDSGRVARGSARRTVRSSLRVDYGLVLYVAALVRLGRQEATKRGFDPVDALVLLACAVAYAVVVVAVLGFL